MKLFILLILITATKQNVCGQSANCPEPERNFYPALCSAVDDRERDDEGDGTYYYLYEALIAKAACVNKSDSAEVATKKIQAWWNKYKLECKCNTMNFILSNGNILKYAVQNTFDEFIKKIVKEWKLDINFIDPKDGKTVLDFTKEEYDRMYKLSRDNQKTKSLERIFKLLRDYGALYKSELK